MRALPLLLLAAIPLAVLRAAPVPKEFSDVVEEFAWKGEKRSRTVRTLTFGGEKVEFVKVPKGAFEMGSDREADRMATVEETPRHEVAFTKPLWVGKHPVTKGQFAAFVKATGHKTDAEKDHEGGWGFDGTSEFVREVKYSWRETGWDQTDRHPVANVSWHDAEAFAAWAAKASKAKVRLPTEAEFEYASRGGTTTPFHTGDEAATLEGYANVADASAKAKWRCSFGVEYDDGEGFTSPVGKYEPNGFGLHDTTGNVSGWCADWYDPKLYAGRTDGVADPKPNAGGPRKERSTRGAGYVSCRDDTRPATRRGLAPASFHHSLGFRVCVEPE